ncbi:MAG: helicase [Cyanobacteria bacterium M5B4]|nr:MAG: helicase [Cyanobacteria bacterium M5B4]
MTNSFLPTIGSVVECRDRTWVVLPSDNADVIRLRPLSGNEHEICGIFTKLGLEPITSAEFPQPVPEAVQDHKAALLLLDAARLSLRNGAGPFRSLGRLSVYPRPYQIVPLLMALRLETVRLLIADDVGIGKTIEAGLIAREMLDRQEIKRIGVLCPPHLCDQWQKELREKFHIEAVVIRSGTVGKLERSLPGGDHHIFSYYAHIIVSLDYAKSDKRRASFLAHCPDLVIVDEVHTCARPSGQSVSQQQRHQLVNEIAENQNQHLILLSATPHSGIEESFLSILGLIKPEFATMNLESLSKQERTKLANHFIQRRRADVKKWLGNETPFPERLSTEISYKLTKEYRDLFNQVYDFARGLVRGVTDDMSYAQKRGRYWAALALIRCVMSSPAAAVATLNKQVEKREVVEQLEEEAIDEDLMASYVYDPTEQEQSADAQPTLAIEQRDRNSLQDGSHRRKFKAFVQSAQNLYGAKDAKLQQAIATVTALLNEGHQPIIWCRYIATAQYVAKYLGDALKEKLGKKSDRLRVLAITGEQSEDEREIFLQELGSYEQRVLVATDCLSEGVNLQEYFSAVLHYDLPWNPNRLEQREGRVDRYGQKASQVKCALLCGQDNPIDDVVLKILIRKAVKIHRSLGITVPVPIDNADITERIFNSLFEYEAAGVQLSIFESGSQLALLDAEMNRIWQQAEEKVSRTRFAQMTITSEDVQQELIESDRVLGSAKEIERFVRSACGRMHAALIPKTIQKHPCWLLPHIPEALKNSVGESRNLTISFVSPTPVGVEFIGRNHPLVEGLARYILEDVLSNTKNPIAARCGFTITDAVTKRTTLLLLRLRHLLDSPQHHSLLSEECLVVGFTGAPSEAIWLEQREVLRLIEEAQPVANPPSLAIVQLEIRDLLKSMEDLREDLELIAKKRSQDLTQSHRRVRAITREGQVKVEAQLPMDLLGVYVLKPK